MHEVRPPPDARTQLNLDSDLQIRSCKGRSLDISGIKASLASQSTVLGVNLAFPVSSFVRCLQAQLIERRASRIGWERHVPGAQSVLQWVTWPFPCLPHVVR